MIDKLRDARDHIRRMENRIAELATECNRLYGIGQDLVGKNGTLRIALKNIAAQAQIQYELGVGTRAEAKHILDICQDALLPDSDPPKEAKLHDTPCSP